MLDLSAIAVMDTLRSQNTVQKPLTPTTTVGYSPVTALKSMPADQTTNHNGLNSNLTNGITANDQLTNGMLSPIQITNGMSASDQLTNGMGSNDEFQSCDLPTVLPSPPQLAVRTKVNFTALQSIILRSRVKYKRFEFKSSLLLLE